MTGPEAVGVIARMAILLYACAVHLLAVVGGMHLWRACDLHREARKCQLR